MKFRLGPGAICLAECCNFLGSRPAPGQTTQVNQTQRLAFAGLHSASAQGQFNAVKTDAAGNLYLLLDQHDGVRLFKTDNSASQVLAQAQLGAAGDSGLALALDPAGSVYVAGTTTSTSLTGTQGAAIPARSDASTNSFIAKFDSNLNLLFVTFTGGSRIAASALAATSDAVFVTGSLFSATLPVTPDGIQQAPATGSSQNGFVEKFSGDGSTLLYATYLTGAAGNTMPAGIAADATDHAYIVGETTASGFPTLAAVVPAILSNPSGFLTKLTPAGDGIVFSTFIPGPGLSSIALDPSGQTLLLSGALALGQFPVQTVSVPIAPTPYQSVFTMPLDGSAVPRSILLAPAAQSFVSPSASGDLWIDGTFSQPLLPGPTLVSLGTGFAVRVNPQNVIDHVARFGGLPNANSSYASLPAILTSLAVDPAGEPILAGSVQPTASSSLLASETYDLPLLNNLTAALPSTLRDSETSAAACSGSLCAGSAAYLAKLDPTSSAPSLAFSADDAPFVVLRNLGSAQATGLAVSATGASLATNCGTTLPAGGECDLLLSGTGPASVTVSASNAPSQSVSVPPYPATVSTIVFSPKELDFGIQTSASPPGARIVTLSNLGATTQTFTSAVVSGPKSSSPYTELTSDCTSSGALTSKSLLPGATCHVTVGLTAASTPPSDGFQPGLWQIGSRTVQLNGYTQAAALSVSAAEIDFGTQYKSALRLPRFLYLSNASSSPIAHTPLALAASSPFTLTDACPSVMLPQSVCGIRIDYLSSTFPSKDSVALALDQGLSVLVTGQSLPQPGVGGNTVNPNLSVAPASLTFLNAVVVTGVSGATQTVSVTNSGASPFTLTLSLTGDFSEETSCPPSLPSGQTCAVAITFSPTQPGIRQGLLSISAGSGFSPAYVSLTGTGTGILPANNGALDFGSTPIAQPVVHFYKISQPFTTLSATATGPYSVLFIPDIGYGPGEPASTAYAATSSAPCPNCFLAVRFDPTAAGSQPGTLTLSSDPAGFPYTLALTGVGLPTNGLLLTPLAQSFGSVPINSTGGPILFTLTNLTSPGAITLNPPVVTGDFALNSTPTGGQSCSGTLAYTASCELNLDFAPTASGARTGSLTFTSSSGSVSASLAGFGTPDPGLALNPTSLTFSNIPGALSSQQTVSLTNTGAINLLISAPSVTSSSFSLTTTCSTLAPSATCTITVAFQPGSAIVLDTLAIPVVAITSSGPANTLYTVALTGAYTASGAGLQIVPGQVLFGPTPTGVLGVTRQFSLVNSTARTLAITLSLPRQFALTATNCSSVPPAGSCSFTMEFIPLTNTEITGSLFAQGIPSDASLTLTSIVYLDGFGVAQAGPLTLTGPLQSSVENSPVNFGQVASGQTRSLTLALTNRNSAASPAITVRRVSSAPPFLSTSTCGAPLTSGQSCTVTLRYAPSNQVAIGSASPPSTNDTGLLTVESDASSSPDLIDLAGQGGPLPVSNPSNLPPLATFTLSQSSLTFASVPVGDASPPQAVILTNTGTIALHIASIVATPDFTLQGACGTLLAGTNCTFTVTSTPQTSGPHIAAVQIASDAASSLEFISLLSTATPSSLVLAPTALDFGSLAIGSSTTLNVQVTNSGNAPVQFAGIMASGDYSTAGTCPLAGASLPAKGTCTTQVTFTPTLAGTRPGNLSVATSASTLPLTVSLTGIGTQSQLLIAPSAVAFGPIVVGASANLTLTLTNTGSAAVTDLGFATTGDYAITLPCLRTFLAPGTACSLQVTFAPTTLGTRPGTLTISSSDPASPGVVPLTGSGIQSGSFTLTVDGGPSASVSVASGTPASYTLTLTSTGGYTGAVALTCAAVAAGTNANCSLQPSTLSLAGGSISSVAVINTVTSVGGNARFELPLSRATNCLALSALLFYWKLRHLPRKLPAALILVVTAFAVVTAGCGGGVNRNLRYTPAGTYQYQVTASSTSGVQITQSVTLNLTVE